MMAGNAPREKLQPPSAVTIYFTRLPLAVFRLKVRMALIFLTYMAKLSKNNETEAVNSFRFSLTGLLLFTLVLIGGTALVAGKFFDTKPKPYAFAENDIPDPAHQDKDIFIHKGPWGELLTQNIKLERPAEYIALDEKNPEPESWSFKNLNLEQIKALLAANGLSKEQVEAQLTPAHITYQGTTSVFSPDENFLLSLPPETRQKLYGALYGMGVGTYFDYPFIFPKDSIETIYTDSRLQPDELALLKQLVYPAVNSVRLTDYNLLLRKISTPERRAVVAKVLSMQPAVLARLCVRPDSDIDKIAAYWGGMDNVRFTDIRPMLEALKGLPHGGTVSLMYFLPPFARSRLYTYPLPAQPGDPVMDCHWSTFNFSSLQPDNRFNDPKFAVDYIQKNFYRIDAPSIYGDILLYVNDKNEIKHSAVYLADDLAFTKYGDNYRQPWMIVRLADMQTMYPTLKPFYYRRKVD